MQHLLGKCITSAKQTQHFYRYNKTFAKRTKFLGGMQNLCERTKYESRYKLEYHRDLETSSVRLLWGIALAPVRFFFRKCQNRVGQSCFLPSNQTLTISPWQNHHHLSVFKYSIASSMIKPLALIGDLEMFSLDSDSSESAHHTIFFSGNLELFHLSIPTRPLGLKRESERYTLSI